MMRQILILFGLQLCLVPVALVQVAVLENSGVPQGAAFAIAAALVFPIFLLVLYRMKQREKRRVAAMSSTERERHGARESRVAFGVALLGTAVFAVLAATAQTPQTVLLLVLYLVVLVAATYGLWERRRGGPKTG